MPRIIVQRVDFAKDTCTVVEILKEADCPPLNVKSGVWCMPRARQYATSDCAAGGPMLAATAATGTFSVTDDVQPALTIDMQLVIDGMSLDVKATSCTTACANKECQ